MIGQIRLVIRFNIEKLIVGTIPINLDQLGYKEMNLDAKDMKNHLPISRWLGTKSIEYSFKQEN